MNDIETIALFKASDKMVKKIDLSPIKGKTFEIDKTLRIRLKGTVTIGLEYQEVIQQSVKWQQLAIVALSHLNQSSIDHVVKMALEGNEFPDLPIEETSQRVDQMIEKLAIKAKKTCKGKVTCKATLETV
jgi:hypothetical protein